MLKLMPSFKPAISYRKLNKVLGQTIFGKMNCETFSSFEKKFAQYLGVNYAIGVPSARWGLYYILQSLGLEESDEVILPAFTYFAVPAAIIKAGLKPVFVDINSYNLNINIHEIEKNITPKTKVLILTHLCGFPCEIDRIINIAKTYNLIAIEDCAQSLAAEYKNKKVGSFGDAAYFTFGTTKHFTTLGGGMVVTNNAELAFRIQKKVINIRDNNKQNFSKEILKAYSMKLSTASFMFLWVYFIMKIFSCFGVDIIDKIFHEKEKLLGNPSVGGRLNSIQAELGLEQLDKLDMRIGKRINNGISLYNELKNYRNLRIPLLDKEAKNIFSGFPILVKNKKIIKKMLLDKGIDVSMGYMKDCARLDMFREFRKKCPNASKAEDEILHLPLYAELTYSDLAYIAETAKECF